MITVLRLSTGLVSRVDERRTLIDVTIGERKRPLAVSLATSPMAVVHPPSIWEHEALVTVGRGAEIRHTVVPVSFRNAVARE